MKIFLWTLFISTCAFAQNIDRVRLHQEMDFLTTEKQTESNEDSNKINNEKSTSNKPIAEDDLEKNYFNDQVQTKKAAPKRQK